MQAAQAVHAAFQFAHEHKDLTDDWLTKSNYLVIVAVPDEDSLMDLITQANMRNITRLAVREPDLDNEITAVVLAPGSAAKKLCASFPLAIKELASV